MKWRVLVLVFAAAALRLGFSAGVRDQSLREAAQSSRVLIGTAVRPAQLSEAAYASTRAREFNMLRGKIFAGDVVNEAFDELQPGKLRSTIWRDQPGIGLAGNGSSYIERCFRWAHEADPQALLFYNEAGAEVVNPKSDAIYAMVRDFRQRGVPIDGVGFQMHIEKLRADVASISANIKRFTALGVEVHITEMDVALPVDPNGNPRFEDLQLQADIYREVSTACLFHPGCTAIQTWGFTDKYSRIGSHSKHAQGGALPFDRNYGTKPAYEALRNALAAGRR
jgi:endo-1,4-beta-xylanase